MLYPRESETREVKGLNGIWNFKLDFIGVGLQKEWFSAPLKDTILMPVPSSFNDITQDPKIRDHVGDVWYEKMFFVSENWKDKRVVLRVGSASHKAIVWVNGKEVIRHKGGFLPFEADVTNSINFGKENRITLCVNNVLDWTTLPPGEVKSDPSIPGYRYQEYQHDFYNYAGIHRPVRLYTTPQTFIDDITVVPDIDGKDGILKYFVKIHGDDSNEIEIEVTDENGLIVGKSNGEEGSIRIHNAFFWEPLEPYLYTFAVKVVSGNGRLVDCYRLPVGIRTVRVEGNNFLINGRPFYFKGFGKHEDMDIKGKGMDEAIIIKDFNLMKWIGANSFRTSHYPYAEEILNIADKLGFVVIDESPAVGLYMFKGKQDVFTPDKVNVLLEHHLEVMRQMINRDKNHPSVVMWSVANEAASQEKVFDEYFRHVFEETRKLDPQNRPVTMAFHTWFDNDYAVKYADVICLNRYWGWYGMPGHLDLIEAKAEWEISKWYEYHKKPIMLTEYGADTIVGFHSDPPVVFSEEYQWQMIKRINNVLDRLDYIIGEHIWNFADFMTKQGITRVIGNRKGVFTRQRQPKMVAHFLKERWGSVSPRERPLKSKEI